MSKGLIAAFAWILAVVLLVAGCGGSDSSTASITKAEFVKQADTICKEGNARILADFAAYSKENEISKLKNPTDSDYTDLISAVLVPNVEQEVEEIRALGAPKGDEDQIDAMLEAQEEGIEKSNDNPKSVVTGESDIFAESNKDAKEYGLETCSE